MADRTLTKFGLVPLWTSKQSPFSVRVRVMATENNLGCYWYLGPPISLLQFDLCVLLTC